MGPEEGDEHFHHHPVCEVCYKEFDDVEDKTEWHKSEKHTRWNGDAMNI
jgi:hypothetical protein